MDEMKLYLICLIALHAALSRKVYATITVVSSVINDSAVFNCSTPSDSVEWLFGSEQYPQPFIYSYGTVNSLYKDRFRIEVYGNGIVKQFNLILQSVNKEDAGRYLCRNDSQNDVGKEVHLIVLETGPTCDADPTEVIGPNSCGIEPETIQVSCSVRYSGNKAPNLLWMKVGGNISIKPPFVACSNLTNRPIYTCNLTMSSDLTMDGSSYICQTTGSATKQYNCTSKAIKVIHATSEYLEINATVNEKASCFVNSSRPCNYTWKFNSSEESVSYGQDIYLTSSESYICEAVCPMRDKNCTITAKRITVSSQSVAIQSDAEKVVSVAVVVVVVVLVAAVLLSIPIIVVVIYRYKVRKENESEKRQRAGDAEHREEMKPLSSGAENSNESHLEVKITDAAGESPGTPLIGDSNTQEIKGYTERIRGLTLLNDRLYVTTKGQSTVEIFDSKTKKIKNKMVIDSLTDPGTMASCTKNNCIYIIDKKTTHGVVEIFKYCPDKVFASKWLSGAYGRLSVTKKTGDVVLAAYNRRGKSMLKIFSTDGAPLHTITFSKKTRIESLWHAVELSQGDFVVSHGSIYEESPLHRVCIVHKGTCRPRYTVKKSIGSKSGPGENELNEPSYMALTSNGSILVVDTTNHRILLLSKDLEVKQVLFKNEEYLPKSLYLDEENGQLFIGCNLNVETAGRVLCIPCSVE